MKISVITPTLNREHYLRDVMDSVLWQDYSNLEYIVVDGGSTDGTLKLLEEYKEKFNQAGKTMHYISEKDNGLYDSMNKGVRMASGDVVGILNDDDFFNYSDCISKIADSFSNKDTEAVYADSYYVNESNIFKPVRCYNNRHFTPKRLLYGYIPDHETFYMKKDYYDKYGYINTDYNLGGDMEFILRMVYVCGVKAEYIDKVLITNRIGGVSTSGGLKMYFKRIDYHMEIFSRKNIKTYRYRLWLRYVLRVWNKIYIPKRFLLQAKQTQQWFAHNRSCQ